MEGCEGEDNMETLSRINYKINPIWIYNWFLSSWKWITRPTYHVWFIRRDALNICPSQICSYFISLGSTTLYQGHRPRFEVHMSRNKNHCVVSCFIEFLTSPMVRNHKKILNTPFLYILTCFKQAYVGHTCQKMNEKVILNLTCLEFGNVWWSPRFCNKRTQIGCLNGRYDGYARKIHLLLENHRF